MSRRSLWLGLFAFALLSAIHRASIPAASASDGPLTNSSALPGSPSECYLMQDVGSVMRDSCGHHDGILSGTHYTLSLQGITWNEGGSQVTTDVTHFPMAILACFTHGFGGTKDAYEVTRGFEKYPSLLTSDDASGDAVTLEGQDGNQQGLTSANLGFLYFAEGRSQGSKYSAATKDGTNGGPHCLIVDRTMSGGDKFYLDGVLMSMAYNESTGASTLGKGHLVIGGRPGDSDFWFNGTLHLLVLWDDEALQDPAKVNRALSWANDQLRAKGLPAAGSTPPNANDLQSRFVILGDSIAQCAGAPITPEECWAKNIHLQNPAIETVRLSVGGSSGQFGAITSPWREATLIDPKAPFNIAQFYYGINDGCRNQFSEEQVWQRATQWSRYMHSLGVRTLFTTMIDLDRASACGNKNESGAQFKRRLNAIARSNYQGVFDGLVDFASFPALGADGASLGQCFGPDKIHPSAACQNVMIQMTEDSANYLIGDALKYVRQSGYVMTGGDKRILILPDKSKDMAITLPSCYGKTNMPYTIANGALPFTGYRATLLSQPGETIFGMAGQSIEVQAGHTVTVVAVVEDPSLAGCTWMTM
jgi:hypothetical protein